MNNTHELKTDPEVFEASFSGKRDYEIRYNDRDFKVGDWLILKETKYSGEEMKAGKPLIYTGRSMDRKVCHILSGYGLSDGWVILAVNSKEQLQQQNRELVARVARLEKALKNALLELNDISEGVYVQGHEALNESPQASLAEIEAAAIEVYGKECERLWADGTIAPTPEEYAANLRAEGK